MFVLMLLQATIAPVAPPVIRPAPDPWPTPEHACQMLQDEARRIALRQPRARAAATNVEQAVDCDARVITRVYAVRSRTTRLADSAQATANKLACLNVAYQIMYERDGWSFRAEFRGPDQRVAVAAANAKCKPLNLGRYQSPP